MGKSIHVIHVDDDPEFTALVSTVLPRQDDRIDVQTSSTPSECLELLAEDSVDCVVADYQMADMDGLEFLTAVRQEYPGLPFLLFTGKGSEEVASEALTHGATDYIQKGDGTEQFELLANRILNAVEQYRSKQRATQLDRIRTLTSDVTQALVRAESRSEAETRVCEIISDSDPYLFAWIGDVDLNTDRIEPRTSAGIEDGYLNEVTITADNTSTGQGPGGTAIRERRVAVSQQVADDPDFEPRREEALERGYRAVAAVPLEYGNTLYGILFVYAGRPEMFNENEQELLTELGTDIAQTIDAFDLRENLREERDRRTALFKNAPGPVIAGEIHEQQDRQPITDVNDAFEDVFGYERATVIGKDVAKIVIPNEEMEQHETFRDRATAGEATIAEVERSTADGLREFLLHIVPYGIDSGHADGWYAWYTDITQRKQRERRFEAIFNNTYTFVGLMDPDGTIREANETALSFGGLTREEVIGKPLWKTPWIQSNEDAKTTVRDGITQARNGQLFRDEIRVQGSDRDAVIDFSIRPVTDEQGEITSLVPEGRDITERKRHEGRLTGLNELLLEYLEADTKQHLCDMTVNAAHERLTIPVTLIALFDGEANSLDIKARTPAAEDHINEDLLLEQDGNLAWGAFTSEDLTIVDISDQPGIDDSLSMSHLVGYPLGKHGALLAGVPSDGTGDVESGFIKTVANNLRDAIDRIEREELLRDREQLLEEQNEYLDRLNRINDVIRNITQVLVGASSREEIERTVCEELADAGPYQFAWIGEQDATIDGVKLRESADDEMGHLDAIKSTSDNFRVIEELTEQAVSMGETRVIGNLLTEPPLEPWREAAIKRGYRSCIALPLIYRDRVYGVLAVYANQPGLFDGIERNVLMELGETIAHAINALESKRALVSDTVIQVEVAIGTADTPFSKLVSPDAAREFDLESVVPADEGLYRLFCTIQSTPPEDVLNFAKSSLAITDYSLIAERDEACFFECTVTEDSLVAWLLNHGAVPRELSINDEGSRITVELAKGKDVRGFLEMLRERCSSVELLARQEHERSEQVHQTFRSTLDERLTDRQQEILQTAYHSGFFNSPRERTGGEIAESIGIAQPTFSAHLRAGMRKALALLYDDPAIRRSSSGS